MIYPPNGYEVVRRNGKHFPMTVTVYKDGSFTLVSIPGSKGTAQFYTKRMYAVAFCYQHKEGRKT